MAGEIVRGGGGEVAGYRSRGNLKLRHLEFTDLYISQTGRVLIRGVDDSKGPLTDVPDGVVEDLDELQLAVMAESQKKNKKEFFIDFDEVRYRVSRIQSLEGDWYTLRKSKSSIPRLKDLGFPGPILKHLAWMGSQSGLLLVAGATGQGKTTTACSLLREYLMAFGDIAVTIEDPPEMMLNGDHGNFGHCFQLMLDEGETFGSALVASLRYTPRYIFLGELRKPEDASQALRAAISGHLVISTVHAGSVEEALNSMIKLASAGDDGVEFARDQLASALAGVIHQKLVRSQGKRRLILETLFTGDDKGIKALIRDGQVNQIGTAIQQQSARVLNNRPPVDIPKSR